MNKNNIKITIIKNIIKRLINTEKYSVYRISKETKITVKTIEKILKNTSSNINKNTIEKFFISNIVNKNEKKELLEFLNPDKKTKKSMGFEIHREKMYTKNQLNEYEKEIIETYDIMRDEKSVFSKIASVNRELININKMLEESFLKLDLLIYDDDDFFQKKIKRPLKSTIKNLEIKKEKLFKVYNKLENIYIEKEKKMVDISNLIPEIPLTKFTKEQKRVAILVWVAKNIKIRLKDYNINGKLPTGYSTRLWAAGRESSTKTKMDSVVRNNIKLYTKSADDTEELKIILEEITEEIIENSMIVTEEFLKAARNAKTQSVRNKYLKGINNTEYLKVAFIIGVLYYAKNLMEMNQDLKHKYLEIRMIGIDEKKEELNNIWRKYGKGEIDYENATVETEKILSSFEQKIELTNFEADQLTQEKLIYNLMGEKNLELLLENILDDIREKVTGQINMFKNKEIEY